MNCIFIFSIITLFSNLVHANVLYEEPLQTIQREAIEGDSMAQRTLGQMYSNGIGVVQSDENAIFWYEKAANQGDIRAQFFLGVRLASRGQHKQAFSWYSKSAKKGDPDAQFALGVLYQNGDGITQDDINAYAWFSVSAANGHPYALGLRDKSRKNLTNSSLIYAQALASEFFEVQEKNN